MQRIRGFDGLRALSVLAVFVGHRSPLHGRAIGHVGVLVFFALSGFLIVGILQRGRLAMEAGTSTVGAELRRFFAQRTRRIFPVYYLVLAALAAAAFLSLPANGWRWSGLLWHLAYLSNVYEGHVVGWQGALSHLWSLSVEEQFYLLAAPLLFVLPARWHLWACSAVVLAGLGDHVALIATGADPVAIYTDSLTNFGFIAMGGALRLVVDAGGARRAGLLIWPLIPALLALGFVPDPQTNGAWLIVTPALAALLVLGVARAQTSRLVALLEDPTLVYLGRISYGFYLFHNLFWLSAPLSGPAGVLTSMALNFAATLGLATASWFLLERPILTGRASWATGREQIAT